MAARYFEITRSGVAQFHDASMIEPHGAVADGFHVGDGVGDEEDGDAARAQLMHLAHAALAEIDIAHGQGFIHQQNFRIDIDGDGEGQAHHHAAGISFHRLIDELADFGEALDVLVALVDLRAW